MNMTGTDCGRSNVTRQGAIDASRQSQHAIAETALAHVILEAQDQSVEEVGFGGTRNRKRRRRWNRGDNFSIIDFKSCGVAFEGCKLQHRLLRAVVDQTVSVEDQVVVASDLIDEREGNFVPRNVTRDKLRSPMRFIDLEGTRRKVD